MKKNKKINFKHVSANDYKNIKLMQKAQLSMSDVSRITKRSHNTVTRIFKSNTLDEYKQLVIEHGLKYQPKKDTTPPIVAAAQNISEVVRQAKLEGGIILTTHAAFIGFDDLYSFIKEASDNEVVVTFAPMGSKEGKG